MSRGELDSSFLSPRALASRAASFQVFVPLKLPAQESCCWLCLSPARLRLSAQLRPAVVVSRCRCNGPDTAASPNALDRIEFDRVVLVPPAVCIFAMLDVGMMEALHRWGKAKL